jgi:hypothetical protein
VTARTTVAVTIFLVSWGLTTHGKYSATGDEPHYLLVAQSLRSDRDLDLENNYAHNDAALFGASGLQPELHARRSRTGRLLPVHDIGIPVVLLPAYVVAANVARVPSDAILRRFHMNRGLFAYSLISLVIIAIVTSAAVIMVGVLEHEGLTGWAAASVVCVAWLSPPVLSNSFLVFPEPFALLITASAVALWAARRRHWGRIDSAVVLALGVLPWFHRKYALFAVALLGVGLWRRRGQIRNLSNASRVGLAVTFLAPSIALAVWTLHTWGNLLGPLAFGRLPFSWSSFANGIVGLFLDRENGLLWWAPIYALLPAAWWLRRSDLAVWLLPVGALLIPSAAHDQWWGGFSPAGRFLVPLVPVFCLASVALIRQNVMRYAAFALIVPQVAITAYGWQHPHTFWPRGDGNNRVLAALCHSWGSVERWLPSFRSEPASAWPAAVVLLLILAAANVALIVVCRSPSSAPDAHG